MKSKVNPAVCEPAQSSYPCILQACDSDTIVLFTQPNTGVTLSSTHWGIGHWSDKWAEQTFIVFEGDITLSN